MKRYFKHFVVFLVFCLFVGCDVKPIRPSSPVPVNVTKSRRDDAQKIYSAYRNRQSNIFVESKGGVVKILPDDLKGSRHQRFILQLKNGQKIFIAHNIDIAPRIDNLNIGDLVYFYGEYEWNNQGGVVHWTHHDPQYRKVGGWLEHKGMKYQ